VPGGDRSSADDLLAAALAAGQEVAEAARAAGVSERTAYRRLAEPEFKRHVGELRGAMVSQALGRLSDAMTAAADRLRKLVDSADEKVALGAAKAVLELTPRLREAEELQGQLDELRQLVEGLRGGNGNAPPASREAAGGGGPPGGPGDAGPGGDPQGPDGGPRPDGPDPGPLAGEVAPLALRPGAHPLFPPGR
jgi:hypothetical protein